LKFWLLLFRDPREQVRLLLGGPQLSRSREMEEFFGSLLPHVLFE
jgi:hypothetical protein